MADIKHAIQIAVAPGRVHPLVASAAGLKQWWAEDVTEDRATGNVTLGFFNRATVYELHLREIAAPLRAHWLCQSGKEWGGTRLLFDLSEQKGQTLLRFTHAGWQAETDYFVACTTTWGELMFRIKAVAEGNTSGSHSSPLFSASGLAY